MAKGNSLLPQLTGGPRVPPAFNPFIQGGSPFMHGGGLNPFLIDPATMDSHRGTMGPGALPSSPATRSPTPLTPKLLDSLPVKQAGALPPPAPPPPSSQPQGFGATLKSGINNVLGGDEGLAWAAGVLGGGTSMQALGRGFQNALAVRAGGEKPGDVKEYEYAVSQGYAGTFADYQKDMRAAGATKVDLSGGKLTEGQSKDVGFYARGRYAELALQDIDEELASLPGFLAGKIPMGEYLKTPEYQVAEREGREFIAVILRKDTGAAVTDTEFALYFPMYMPQPGNSPEVIASKRAARSRAMAGIRLGLGNARAYAEEIDNNLAAEGGFSVEEVP